MTKCEIEPFGIPVFALCTLKTIITLVLGICRLSISAVYRVCFIKVRQMLNLDT